MNILVFAPHPDDEILGCGGVIARHVTEGDRVTVCIVTSVYPPICDNSIAIENGWPHNLYPEIIESHKVLGVSETLFLKLPCVLLEHEPRNVINAKISEAVKEVNPDIVYIPHAGDMQKDHRIVSDAVMVAMRPVEQSSPRYVYSYETMSETEWNIPSPSNAFIPNTFVDISDYLDKKIAALNCCKTEMREFPNPRSTEAITALAKYRGSTMCCKAAEAFMLIREYRK